ncbi:basic proline-rich protein-like [Marmota monax]|uniref:basic proline-rich protein-like n=1 Tax=Marmota monax TaxID=9995 RepID=UPI001EB07794|nr:basic proline-rich protein-like [Marmota monax]
MEIPRAPSPREVLRCYPSAPRATPPPAGPEPDPTGDRAQPGRAPGIPAVRRLAGVGAVTGVQVSGVQASLVKCNTLPCLRSPPGIYQSPPSGSLEVARPWPPAASAAFPRELGPHLCPPPPPPLARSLRLCRRRSEPHTHRYTQPSDVTVPSARPRHCGDTRLPADAAAVSGRPRESEGGGEGEGEGTEPAAAPRTRARRRRRPLAAPSPFGDARAVWPIVAPQGSPPPRSVPPRARARPNPQARARRSWPSAPSGRLARGAVCGAPGADRMFPPRPTPTAALPPSFLESPSRLSGAATAPPPPHPRLCGDGPDPGAPWPLGRRATGREGAGRPLGALCATPAAGRAEAERRCPRSGVGDPPPADRSWAAPPRR